MFGNYSKSNLPLYIHRMRGTDIGIVHFIWAAWNTITLSE
jgi:hypothetical protein